MLRDLLFAQMTNRQSEFSVSGHPSSRSQQNLILKPHTEVCPGFRSKNTHNFRDAILTDQAKSAGVTILKSINFILWHLGG